MDYSALCRQILDGSLRARPGERVWINGWDHSVELTSALERETKKRGCEVVTTIQSEEAWLRSAAAGPIASLRSLSSFQEALLREADSYVFILGPRRPIDWARISRRRRGLMTLWFLESNEFVERWMSIARRKGIKMLGIEATLATEERAEARGVDYRGWREAMITGCLADASAMGGLARKLSRRLGGHSEVRLLSPSGTNFTFSLDDRRVEILDGRATEGKVTFLPAGHVGTTVDEESAEGTISYDSPIIFPEGRTEKLRLKVRRGKIVEYNAAVGASHFRDHLRSLGGDSDRFAFFGIGLNPLLRFGHTQDDKVLGAVELNFGESLSRGGRNRGRGDWWGIATRVSMAVGGHALMERGRLLV